MPKNRESYKAHKIATEIYWDHVRALSEVISPRDWQTYLQRSPAIETSAVTALTNSVVTYLRSRLTPPSPIAQNVGAEATQ